jgi:branched-chain amino acid transport system substrate-binding protein
MADSSEEEQPGQDIINEILNKRMNRRKAISTMGKVGAAAVLAGIAGGVVGYVAGGSGAGGGNAVTTTTGTGAIPRGSGTFKIGTSITTSGPTAPIIAKASDMFNAIVSLVNARGGIYAEKLGGYVPIKVITYPDDGSAASIKSNYTKLVTSDNIDFALGPVGTTGALAATSVTIPNGVPYIDCIAGEVPIFTQQNAGKWVVGAINVVNFWLWNYLNVLKTTDAKTVAILDHGEDFTSDISGNGAVALGGKQFAQTLGFNVLTADHVNPTFSPNYDYTSEIQKLKSLNPDAILYCDFAAIFSASMLQQMKTAGYKPKAYHAIQGSVGGFTSSVGDLKNGVSAEVYWDPAYPYQGFFGVDLWNKVRTQAGFTDLDFPWLSIDYMGLEIACAAVQYAGTTDKTAVANALSTMQMTALQGPWKAQNPVTLPFPPPSGVGIGAGQSPIIPSPIQWQNGNRIVIGPPNIATGKYIYPEPLGI